MCGVAQTVIDLLFVLFCVFLQFGGILEMVRRLQNAGDGINLVVLLQIICFGLCLRPPQINYVNSWQFRAASLVLSVAMLGACVWQLQQSNNGTSVVDFVKLYVLTSIFGLFGSTHLLNAYVTWCFRWLGIAQPRNFEISCDPERLPPLLYEITGSNADDIAWLARRTKMRTAPVDTSLWQFGNPPLMPATFLLWATKRVKSCIASAKKNRLESEVALVSLLDTVASFSALFIQGFLKESAFNSLIILSDFMDAFGDSKRVCHILVLEAKCPARKASLNTKDHSAQSYESMRKCMAYLFAAHASAKGSAGACAVVQRRIKSDQHSVALEGPVNLPAPRPAAVYKGAKNSYAIQLNSEEHARFRYVFSLLSSFIKHDDVCERVNEGSYFLYESECYRVLHDVYEDVRKD